MQNLLREFRTLYEERLQVLTFFLNEEKKYNLLSETRKRAAKSAQFEGKE